jgi:hypothetical protein
MEGDFKKRDHEVERDLTAVKATDSFSVCGYGSLFEEDGEPWNYKKYRDPEDGLSYLMGEDGKILLEDEDGDHQVVDPTDEDGRDIVLRIHELKTRDEAIQMARFVRAKELSHGDKVLEAIILQSAEISRENPRPYQRCGIDFYTVGENASHSFYLGVKDGRIYRYALSDDLCIKDELRQAVESNYSAAINMTGSELKEKLTEEAKEIALTRIVERIIEKIVDYTMILLDDADEHEVKAFENLLNTYITDEELKRFYYIYCDCRNTKEQVAEASELLIKRAKELWRSELEKYIDEALNTSENTPFEYFPAGTNLEMDQELVHDPVDVTDQKSVYISSGTFVDPSELRAPEQKSKEEFN